MSVQALTWAWAQKVGSPTAKAVLVATANFADENGRCWPSQARIADMVEISERSVRDQLALLERSGFLTREARYAKGGGRRTDVYTLSMSKPECASGMRPTIPEVHVKQTGTHASTKPEPASGEPSIEPKREPSEQVARAYACEGCAADPHDGEITVSPRAVKLIAIYDEVGREVYGTSQWRPWPGGTDSTEAGRWVRMGITEQAARQVFTATLKRRHEAGDPPPKTLRYFEAAMKEIVTRSRAPTPTRVSYLDDPSVKALRRGL